MIYRILIVAMILGLGGNSYAGEHTMAASETDSDVRVECIEAGIAEEFEDENLQDQFVETCYQEKMAEKAKEAM